MKRRISLLVCVLVLAIATMAFASCASAHQHTYGDAWQKDAQNHWHAATCTDGDDCTAAKTSEGAHVDANSDCVCDVCGYDYNHTHTYADAYSTDANNHWYAVTCGCSVDAKDKAPHADTDNDGACNTCGYNGGHEHAYITNAWATDGENHWHAASCNHSVSLDKAEHVDENDDGACDVCLYVEGGIDVEKAIELGLANNDKIASGKVIFTSDSGAEYAAVISEDTFALGSNVTKISRYNATYETTVDSWFSIYQNTVFGVEVNDGYATLAYAPSSSYLNGYDFVDVFGYYDNDETSTTNYYGTYELMAGLYELCEANEGEAYVIAVEGAPVYVFSFNYYLGTGELGSGPLFEVEVAFTLSDSLAFETITVTSNEYNDVWVDWSESYEQMIFPSTTEPAAGEVVTWYTTELAPGSVTQYVVTLVEGARNLVNEYKAEELMVSDFKLTDAEGNEIDENYTVEAGSQVVLPFVVIAPNTADMELNNVNVEAATGYWYYADWNGAVNGNAGAPGTITITVTAGAVTKTYTITVITPETTELIPEVDGVEGETVKKVSETGAVTAVIGATANSYADATFTAMLSPAAGMSGATLTVNGDGTYTLTTVIYGEYPIILTSTANADVVAYVTVIVEPAPEVKDILNGGWEADISDYNYNQYGMTNVLATFAPETDGALNGTLTLELSWEGMFGSGYLQEVLTYEYNETDKTITVTHVSGDEIGYTFGISDNYTVTVTCMFGTTEMAVAVPPTLADTLVDLWEADKLVEYWGDMVPAYILNFGYGNGEDRENGAYPDFTWEVDDATGVITITFTGNYSGALATATFVYDADSDTIVATMADDSTVTFTRMAW